MLAILDYRAGNQTSVLRALSSLSLPARVTSSPADLASASGIIFPGVGAAGQAMGHLRATGLDALLRSLTASGKPLLGVCLGCQILLERSEENDTETLGILLWAAQFHPEKSGPAGLRLLRNFYDYCHADCEARHARFTL